MFMSKHRQNLDRTLDLQGKLSRRCLLVLQDQHRACPQMSTDSPAPLAVSRMHPSHPQEALHMETVVVVVGGTQMARTLVNNGLTPAATRVGPVEQVVAAAAQEEQDHQEEQAHQEDQHLNQDLMDLQPSHSRRTLTCGRRTSRWPRGIPCTG